MANSSDSEDKGIGAIVVCKGSILPVFILSFILFLSLGCSENDEEAAVAPGSTLRADDALREAEAKLKAAGLSLSFDEPGALMRPEDLLPVPSDLEDVERQRNIEEAVEQLNIVLVELERVEHAAGLSGEGQAGPLGSVSDRALIHLYLGFAYLFDAISRLLISDDPEVTFVIGCKPNPPCRGWYTFDISPVVGARMHEVGDSTEYPLAFTRKERQAIMDAADLIDDAIVKPKASGIQPQFSSVDRPPYSRYAIWHFHRAANLFGQYKPDIKDTLEDFNECLEELRSNLQDRSEMWGFTYTVPPWR